MRAYASSLLCLGLLTTPAAFAEDEPETAREEDEAVLIEVGTESEKERDEELSTVYSTVGFQKLTADFDNVKDSINLESAIIGMRIPTVPWFGLELNLGFTMIPGEVSQVTPGSPGSPTGCGPLGLDPCPGGNSTTSEGDFAATTIGLFAVFRSTGKFFAMGKVGYRSISSSVDELNDERNGNAWGLGVGYRWNRRGDFAEFGYIEWADKLNALGLTISYNYDRGR